MLSDTEIEAIAASIDWDDPRDKGHEPYRAFAHAIELETAKRCADWASELGARQLERRIRSAYPLVGKERMG